MLVDFGIEALNRKSEAHRGIKPSAISRQL
jgi:hypothetical protein